jgi:hypothetical protein
MHFRAPGQSATQIVFGREPATTSANSAPIELGDPILEPSRRGALCLAL